MLDRKSLLRYYLWSKARRQLAKLLGSQKDSKNEIKITFYLFPKHKEIGGGITISVLLNTRDCTIT